MVVVRQARARAGERWGGASAAQGWGLSFNKTMRALQADRIAARQRARDSAARARRTAEEREAQLQTRRDAYARRTAGEREAQLQRRRDADASRTPEVRETQLQRRRDARARRTAEARRTGRQSCRGGGMHVPGGLLRPGGQGGRAAEEEGCTCQEDC